MPRPSSNLRVFVAFKDDTVFAGEDVECVITFKNVDHTAAPPNGSAIPKGGGSFPRSIDPLEQLRAARGSSQTPLPRNASVESDAQFRALQRRPSHNRTISSLSIVESAGAEQSKELPGGGYYIADTGPERKQERTVSIVSLGGSAVSQRAKHGRSASVQALSTIRTSSRQKEVSGEPPNQSQRENQRVSTSPSPISPSPISETSTPPLMRPSHSRSATMQIRERWLSDVTDQKPELSPESNLRSASSPHQGFTFPSGGAPSSHVASSSLGEFAALHSPNVPLRPREPKPPSPQPREESEKLTKSPTNVFDAKSLEGTPRSSVDIDSASNHSNETLTSDYPAQQTSKLLRTSQTSRASARPVPARSTETLMMGYAQLSGSFSLDGSLVNPAPFEEVKRKAVVGGQAGGGVVGIKQPSGTGGLFGSLNWSNLGGSIGESIGGLMGASNLSSIKEMKGIADSNSVPLLSTSKSVLFVNLRLTPGQSKSYSYRFSLPRGLPPSHKGRAIKVVYNLVIGVQRSNNASGQGQQIKQVEIPFRVFGGVNSQGESLGHDLMAPYIILKDQAQTSALDEPAPKSNIPTEIAIPQRSASSASDFQTYVSKLLTRPRRDSLYGLASPTADAGEFPRSPVPTLNDSETIPAPQKAGALIDQAIRECSNPSSPQHIPTNFTIARSSKQIASLSLSRSALKLGDLITCVIDFSAAKQPCYAFEATLESIEKVDPGLAIRSAQSVERATRRVWARTVENALWARRCTFRAQVPVAATPAFTTTGIGLDWFLRVELVIGVATDTLQVHSEGEEEEAEDLETRAWAAPEKAEQLLEVVAADERGTVLGAMQRLPCHSFEVTIPLRVFGAVASGGEKSSLDDSEGLAV